MSSTSGGIGVLVVCVFAFESHSRPMHIMCTLWAFSFLHRSRSSSTPSCTAHRANSTCCSTSSLPGK